MAEPVQPSKSVFWRLAYWAALLGVWALIALVFTMLWTCRRPISWTAPPAVRVSVYSVNDRLMARRGRRGGAPAL